MRPSEWAEWAGFGSFMIAAMITGFLRLNDPDEPVFSRGFPKWKHLRLGVPFLALAVILGATCLILRALGH